MASINYAAREISVKIVYYGPGLSGKTTNLQIIHRKIPIDHKSDMVSLATETDRTLFFDFLPLDLGTIKGFSTKFQLYTVPGQVYYNATRKLVLRGVDGVVFVADSAPDKIPENIESFQNLEDNLAEYHYKREEIPIIIQYNKRDLPNALSIPELQQQINKYNLPYTESVANKGVGVFDALKLMGKIVIDSLNRKYSRLSRGAPAASAPRAAQAGMPSAGYQYQQQRMPQQYAMPPQQPMPQQYAMPPQQPMPQQYAMPPQQQYTAPVQQGYGNAPAAPYQQPRPPMRPPMTQQPPMQQPPTPQTRARPFYPPQQQADQQYSEQQPQEGGYAPMPPQQGGYPPAPAAPQPPAPPEQGQQQFGFVNFEPLPIEPMQPSMPPASPIDPAVSSETAPPPDQQPQGNVHSVAFPQKPRTARTKIDERDYSVYHVDSSQQSFPQSAQSQSNDDVPTDDTDIRITDKGLNNPPGKQPKGFLSKFFNKEEQQ